MALDFQNYDDESVSVVNTESEMTLETTQFANDKTADIRCGQFFTTAATSGIGEHLITTPAAVGSHVNFISKFAVDASAVDLTENEVDCFKVQRGAEYVVPESNIHSSEAGFTPGDYVVNNAGWFDLRQGAGNWCAFQVLTSGTRNGGGYFRVIGVCSEVQ